MDIAKIAKKLQKNEEGIYFAPITAAVSYPDEGNEACMQIEQDSFWFNHRNEVIAACVKKYSPEKPFFDIGGGNGFVAQRLQADGVDVVMVEPGKAGAAHAQKRGIRHIICATFADAGFEPESIDAAGFFDVIEHVEEDRTFLAEVKRSLKREGLIYLTVPAFGFLWSDEDEEAGHFRRYSLASLRRLLRDAGFDIMYSTYLFSVLPLPIFLFRSIPGRCGLHKKPKDLAKYQREHSTQKGFISRLMQRCWDWELAHIKKGKKIHFGSSCLIIARKSATP